MAAAAAAEAACEHCCEQRIIEHQSHKAMLSKYAYYLSLSIIISHNNYPKKINLPFSALSFLYKVNAIPVKALFKKSGKHFDEQAWQVMQCVSHPP